MRWPADFDLEGRALTESTSHVWYGPLDGPRPPAAAPSSSGGVLASSSASALAGTALPQGPPSTSSSLAAIEYSGVGRGRTSLPALGAGADLLARPSLRAALQDPAAEEASQLKLQLASVRAEIEKKDAALALLPGNRLLEDEQHGQKTKRILQQLAVKTQAPKKNSVQLVQEAALEDDGFIMVKGKDTFPGEDALSMNVTDLDNLKKLCGDPPGGQGSPYGALVVRQGKAYFRQQSVSQCRENMVDDPGAVTYLNSTPQAAALCADIRRAVVRRYELRLEVQGLQSQRESEATDVFSSALAAACPSSSSGASTPCAATAAAAPGTASAPWQDNAIALEAELRRKTALSMELHRRVHQLEADLELQLQYNDQRIDEVKATLERAHGYSKVLVPRQ
eukprot:TRINITY_DN15961_c0_g1_i3.p1 TRINITY_DN15961_c0_g1~~TRINITY_DN15961_c0_g1_i3.p1  ORF type:complete len:395 (-),score=107.77 TRINITY_DN15961_c0_g1_i3:91-1275(-)